MSTSVPRELPVLPLAGGVAETLRARMVRGSLISVTGFGASQALRFAANLLLTRLLYPEAFGVMTLVWSVLYGLEMLSDIGTGPAIVRHERGDEQRFLDTAWTLGIARGLALWLLAWALTPLLVDFYRAPELGLILPAAVSSVWISSFASTKVHTARRHLRLGRVVALDLLAQSGSLAVMLPWAWIAPSVWVLVAGAITGAVVRAIASHLVLPGPANRVRVDRSEAAALWRFGRWILVGSSLQFASKEADRLLVGRLGGLAVLGVYGIAGYLADALLQIGLRLSREVLFPALSSVAREARRDVRRVYYGARLRLDGTVQSGLGFLCGAGALLVASLYDARYAEAGWMFQALCVRVALHFAADTAQSCLVALHRLQYQVLPTTARAVWIAIGLPIGWQVGGIAGLVWAGATCELPALFVLWRGLRREGVLRWERELLAAAFFAGGFAAGDVIARAMG